MRILRNTYAVRPRGDDSARKPLAALVGLLLVLVLALGACSSDGPTDGASQPEGGEQPAEPEPPAEPEQPAETPPPDQPIETPPPDQPTETPPPDEPTEPTPPTDDSTGLSGQDILVLALLGGAVLVVILVATSIASSHSQSKQAVRSAQRSRMAELVGGFRWVLDQGTMEVLTTSQPDQLRRVWQNTSARMVQLEGQAAAMVYDTRDETSAIALDNLGRASAGLRAALDADVSLRADSAMAARQDLVVASAQTVQQRRMDLNAALSNPVLRIR